MMHALSKPYGGDMTFVNVTWTSPGEGVVDISGRAWDGWIFTDRQVGWSLTVGGKTIAKRASVGGIFRGDRSAKFNANLVGNHSLSGIPVSKGDVVEFRVTAGSYYGQFVGVEEQITLKPKGPVEKAGMLVMAKDAGAEKKPSLRVVLEMADGSRLVGTPAEKSLRVNTEYMKVEIALAKIRQCDVRHQEERVVLTLQNGDKLTGILEMDKFRVVTSLGKLAPEFAQIDRLTFSTSQPHGFSPTAAIKMPPQPLNIDFGVWKPNPSPQTGPAAAGREGDFWNAVAVPWNNAHIEGGLKSATGDPSPVQVEMINLGGGCSSGGALSVKSPMLDTFNYPVNNRGGNSQVILHQVPPGKYDLYIYGDNPVPLYYGDYTLTVGGRSYGRKTTFQEGDSGQSTEWVEGSQYVKFAGVKVAPGDKVEILIRPGGETTVGRPIREYPDGLLDRNGPSPGLKLDEETAPTFKGAGPQHPESNSTVTWSGRHYSGPLKMGTAPGGLRHTLADAMICGLQLIPVK